MTPVPLALAYSNEPRSIWHYLDPVAMVRSLWSHRHLTLQFASRNIQTIYKGQALGLVWALLDPLVTLAIYTFVFGVIFHRGQATDPAAVGGLAGYALSVYAGILVFGIFQQTVGASPTLIVNQPNFVKKVVCPLETFPVTQLLVALWNFTVGLIVWLVGYAIFDPSHLPNLRMLMLPIVILPVALLGLGLSWFLSSLGVFIRDLRNPVANILHMMFFLTPIFYTLDSIPKKFRGVIALNPLASLLESSRAVMFATGWPDWKLWGITLIASIVLCVFGYAFFMKSRRAFADVI